MTTGDAVSAARAELLDLISGFGGVVRQVDESIDALIQAAEQRGREGARSGSAEWVRAFAARAERAEAREAALRDALFNLADACDATHDGHKDDLCYVCTAMWEAKAALDATQEAQL